MLSESEYACRYVGLQPLTNAKEATSLMAANASGRPNVPFDGSTTYGREFTAKQADLGLAASAACAGPLNLQPVPFEGCSTYGQVRTSRTGRSCSHKSFFKNMLFEQLTWRLCCNAQPADSHVQAQHSVCRMPSDGVTCRSSTVSAEWPGQTISVIDLHSDLTAYILLQNFKGEQPMSDAHASQFPAPVDRPQLLLGSSTTHGCVAPSTCPVIMGYHNFSCC